MYLVLFVRVLCWLLFWYTLLCVLYSLAIILTRKRELVALICVSCLVTVNFLWLFLAVPWVDLQCVIVVFPFHFLYFVCLTSTLKTAIQHDFFL